MKSIVALVACGLLLAATGAEAQGNQKTRQNQAVTRNNGAGGTVKSVIVKLDLVQAKSQHCYRLIDDVVSGLNKIAANSAPGRKLQARIAALEKDTKLHNHDKYAARAKRKNMEISFWFDSGNLTEIKRKGLSAEQREKILKLGAGLDTARTVISGQMDECIKLGQEISRITPGKVKKEVKGARLQARIISRLKGAPALIIGIQMETKAQEARIALLSKAIRFIAAE